MRVLVVQVTLAVIWHAAATGTWVEAAPDYPTFAAALQDPKNGLYTMYLVASSPLLANASIFLNDPNNNAIVLVPPSSAVDPAVKKYDPGTVTASKVRPQFLYLILPQNPDTRNAVLTLTDGITLNTSLTTSAEFAQAIKETLTTLTFRDEGQGMWYVAGSPPGAQLNISRTLTCGAGRLYIIDALPIMPSLDIATADSRAKSLSVAEALQPENVPAILSTFGVLVMADATIRAMFSNRDLTITIFAPSNQAWSDYFTSKHTTLEAFKGSKDAQDILFGCMTIQRPYMISQFPAGQTPLTDPKLRPFFMVSDGNTSDDNPQVQLLSSRTTSVLNVLAAPARNLRCGKSVVHGIDGVLLPGPVAHKIAPDPSVGTPSNFTAGNGNGNGSSSSSSSSSSGSSSKANVGLIVGVVVGGTAAVVLIALAAICIVAKRRSPANQSFVVSHSMSKHTHMDLPGVHQGIFTRMVAHEFQWTDYKAIPGKTVSVEAGITDTQLDQMLQPGGEGCITGVGLCPVVQLTREQVKDQLVVLKKGILGKGATAMVFKCLWPSRFGPDALLAAKVLREGSDAAPHHLQSFAYEASVLSSLLHPNVVRLYGYCLEPPTVVLILELLPTSLKRMLYDAEPCATHLSLPSLPDGDMGAEHSRLLLTSPSQEIHANDAQLSTPESSAHASSQQQRTGPLARSAVSTGDQSGHHQHHRSRQQHSNSNSSTSGPASELTSDVDVVVTMQPSKAADRKLTIRQVLTITADIAAGLAFMHGRAGVEVQPVSPFQEPSADRTTTARVVHRDLKPANILVNSQGRAKISDFGLAREHHQTTIGTAHLGAGTLPYMAPELLVHAAVGPYAHVSATNRVDIYSLGIMIWEQLAGQRPWQGSVDAALVTAVTQGRRPPLPEAPTEESQLHPNLLDQPASLEALPQLNAVVRACWRQRESKRPTASAVLHELNSLLSRLGLPTTETATSSDYVAISPISGGISSAMEPSSSNTAR